MVVLTTSLAFMLLVGVGLGLSAVLLYNGLTQVKQRRDVLPKLIDTVRSIIVY